jgi:hypothetical protein
MEPKSKRQKTNEIQPFQLLSSARSKFPKYSTTQFVSNFIIDNMGDDPHAEIFHVLDQIIQVAYAETHQEYAREPYMYNIIIDGPTLDIPISATLYGRNEGEDLEIVSKLNFYFFSMSSLRL